ncbi:crossover junction endodeoxyribonuclease RuvC [Lujinxingia vulgaris]|uniref:Crossover junction endodeoxyribonuclease RuvC n=1 Tax=Lujinxingia vulgaris TaxID=2600176 RepID=A0A5C6XG71_9DELT|nr:crossover junction endodeoxyribonuclease RuvC [Lujinxingia vulgaris]TXD36409.1 crossover junction endodeoxyribonuclease RuvC [Lujinxingia vulgaris]
MIVIGIDPGSRFTGYGLVKKRGQELEHVASGRINASRAKTFIERLEIIYGGLSAVLNEYSVDEAAVESVFVARNAMSTIKLGQARGVALLALSHANLALNEYAPTLVKQAVTGRGRASKDTVGQMVRVHLGLRGELAEDAADALAVAICHCQAFDFQRRLQ